MSIIMSSNSSSGSISPKFRSSKSHENGQKSSNVHEMYTQMHSFILDPKSAKKWPYKKLRKSWKSLKFIKFIKLSINLLHDGNSYTAKLYTLKYQFNGQNHDL